MTVLLIVFLTAGLVFCADKNQKEMVYMTYVNARYQFEVKYPKDLLKPSPPPDNNDGRSFDSTNKLIHISVGGSYNALMHTWKEEFQSEIDDFKDVQITYKIFKKNYFVISGYQGNKVIYYKELKVTEDGGDVFLSFYAEYPKKEKETWDSIIATCANSFMMSKIKIPNDTNAFGLGTNADQFTDYYDEKDKINYWGIKTTVADNSIVNFDKDNYKFTKDTEIIDTAILPCNNKLGLVLFMKNPKFEKSKIESDDYYTCTDYSRGNYFSGKAFLSLVDIDSKKVLQTIRIPGINYEDEKGNTSESDVDLPKSIRPGYLYSVTNFKSSKTDATPKIINFKDFFGDGKVDEFVLFNSEDCDSIVTLLAGYDEKNNKILVYPIELHVNGKIGTGYWLERLFIQKPKRKFHWEFELDFRKQGGKLEKYIIDYVEKERKFICNEM